MTKADKAAIGQALEELETRFAARVTELEGQVEGLAGLVLELQSQLTATAQRLREAQERQGKWYKKPVHRVVIR